MSSGYFKGDSWVFQGSFNKVTRVIQGFQGCLKVVSRLFQGELFHEVSQGCFKGL